MRLYADLTDEQLSAEISEYRAAIKKVALGGGIGVVAGEGRRIEYAEGNVNEARTALRDLLAEAAYRGLEIGEGGGAIPVEIG
jgi:diaminopimelate decarboxylase